MADPENPGKPEALAGESGTMERAGVPDLSEEEERLAKESLMADLRQARAKRNRQKNLHGFFAFMGVSPAALLPMLGLFGGGSIPLGITLAACVTGLEGWRYFKANRDVYDLDWRIWELHTGEKRPVRPPTLARRLLKRG
jgi:hypothetical protein